MTIDQLLRDVRTLLEDLQRDGRFTSDLAAVCKNLRQLDHAATHGVEVFVVHKHERREGSRIVGVYATREKAGGVAAQELKQPGMLRIDEVDTEQARLVLR